eukprot:CAMPEP_0181253362 /NCGR_PEP_ID=MMETSP1096-20121128/47973_1 /TAXON_ID=156174 ORGANISM="Chrysochromulina ericina, Strain CCMP281" /NCGR_SAMPLE_ID=MMETSP1096 /ASSEMBLY_ACC=CAM_ASM_000453 /LENGTH=101 /DNA_ID=CAMNT_0023351213 /DNA_START=301 /DNA_END=602 /DNA_ORIENTATION=+
MHPPRHVQPAADRGASKQGAFHATHMPTSPTRRWPKSPPMWVCCNPLWGMLQPISGYAATRLDATLLQEVQYVTHCEGEHTGVQLMRLSVQGERRADRPAA